MENETKICPFCGEEIKAAAIKCKHCQTDLTGAPPSRGPTPPGGVGFQASGDLNHGTIIGGRYRIVSELGRGGMALVYRAWDTSLDRPVALKVLPPQHTFDKDFVERFGREAKLAAKLQHPNIITIYEAGEYSGIFFIAMALVEGETLSDRLRSGVMEEKEAVRIAGKIALALDHAHAQGLVHRDIKPGNIMIRNSDGEPLLMDFGIAKAMEGGRLTRTGMAMGTPEYMSPEQIEGGEVGPASDLYSLGIVMYRMLSGREPFTGATAGVLHKHVYETPAPVTSGNPRVSAGMAGIVAKLLSKSPAARFQSGREVAEALESPAQYAGFHAATAPFGSGDKKQTVAVGTEPGRESFPGISKASSPYASPGKTVPAGKAISPPSLVSKRKPVLLFASILGAAGIMVIFIALGISLGWFGGGKKPAITGGGGGSAEQTKPSEPTKPVPPAAPEGMANIPAGEFWMGCVPGDNECQDDEKPRVKVSVDKFNMDKHEVTNGEYEKCVKSGKCKSQYEGQCWQLTSSGPAEKPASELGSEFRGADNPVVCVDWDMAKSYCAWAGKRLPSEAEWEKAARGGSGSRYYWGGDMNGDYAWYSDNSGNKTHPVGQKKANGFGLYDMLGNVWEWVEDCYDKSWYGKLSSGQRNPMNKCTDSGGNRVIRGGSWDSTAGIMRASNRLRGNPGFRNSTLGFRCAQD